MLPREDLVRRCSYAVAVVTGVDPYEHGHILKGDDSLQKARKLWAWLVACECGINHSEAARLLDRSRSSIIINLYEIEDWRDPLAHPRGAAFDDAMDSVAEALRVILQGGLAMRSAAPSPLERSRMARRRRG